MDKILILMACGRNDRGKLFPRAKRQLEHLQHPIAKIAGNLDMHNCAVFHDGSPEAIETITIMGIPDNGEREFLMASLKTGPDEYELNKTFRLVEDIEKPVIVLVLDHVYASQFASFYLDRLEKSVEAHHLSEGEAVIVEADGTFHLLSPQD
jgi:hypothetical protein